MFFSAKKFNHIVISSEQLLMNESFVVYIGGSSSEKNEYGLYNSGGYNSDGEKITDFVQEDIISYVGSQHKMGEGFGDGGRRPEKGEMPEFPTDENGEIIIPEMPEGKDSMPDKGFFEGRPSHNERIPEIIPENFNQSSN